MRRTGVAVVTLVVAVAILVLAGTAPADAVILSRTNGSYWGSGGEFTIKPLNGPAMGFTPAPSGMGTLGAGTYQSFCIEWNEHVSPGKTYDYVINTGAVHGGAGGQTVPGFDPLDPKTAYLYTRFYNGTLAALGYDYELGTGRSVSAGALQNAIWYIENEVNTLDTVLATTFYNAAVAAAWTGIGSVRVLNLYASGGKSVAQDQLIMIPTPAALFMGLPLLGLLGVCRLVRRHR